MKATIFVLLAIFCTGQTYAAVEPGKPAEGKDKGKEGREGKDAKAPTLENARREMDEKLRAKGNRDAVADAASEAVSAKFGMSHLDAKNLKDAAQVSIDIAEQMNSLQKDVIEKGIRISPEAGDLLASYAKFALLAHGDPGMDVMFMRLTDAVVHGYEAKFQAIIDEAIADFQAGKFKTVNEALKSARERKGITDQRIKDCEPA